jgi:hypothetical protein
VGGCDWEYNVCFRSGSTSKKRNKSAHVPGSFDQIVDGLLKVDPKSFGKTGDAKLGRGADGKPVTLVAKPAETTDGVNALKKLLARHAANKKRAGKKGKTNRSDSAKE